jgi:tetratricopeptide (TPR) repeat protein
VSTTRWGVLIAALGCVVAVAIVFRLLNDGERPTPVTSNGMPASEDAPVAATSGGPAPELAGSQSCRECHAEFYRKWSTSHHGLAMQPYTAELAQKDLTPQQEDIVIGAYRYRADVAPGAGWVREKGGEGEKTYRIEHVMGGKNVYFFLAPLERGRLQVLPVAYNLAQKKWYNTTASMVRHLGEHADEAIHWTDPLLTFNTSCFNCHVSQLSTNYDLKTGSYRTVWAESGISCETCHGPSAEHVRLCKATPKGQPIADPKILSYKKFTVEQINASCALCHAKGMPISIRFKPGDAFFDHSDLVTYENSDHYPDGRDLGENYTYTSWLESPCVKSGKLSCIHCHTSSGRYRFKEEAVANNACLPCHRERVENAAKHHRHPTGKPGSHCIDCHMPTTSFAQMRRSDHSMRPPTPAAMLEFKSPDACTLCHADKGVAWADKLVREWHKDDDYQAPVLARARLIAEARAGKWERLPEMLACIRGQERSEVYATSLIRLLTGCNDERKWPVLLDALKDGSPLVRAAAASGFNNHLTPETVKALLAVTDDRFRIVRVRAAATLAPWPAVQVTGVDRKRLEAATQEYLQSLDNRPDDWASHYNRGNYHEGRGELEKALTDYAVAAKLRPDVVPPLVNASVLYARLGKSAQAEQALKKALVADPVNAEANFNYGLLMAEKGDMAAAEQALRTALKTEPNMAAAAYNLGVILGRDRVDEAILFCRRAVAAAPGDVKYASTLVYYLNQINDTAGAVDVLRKTIARRPASADPYVMLIELLIKQGQQDAARQVLQEFRSNPAFSKQDQDALEALLRGKPGP